MMIVDTYLFNGALSRILPRHPETLLWYTLLFNVPHFFASFFTFADKEYLAQYKGKLQHGIPFIIFLTVTLPLLNLNLAVLYLVIYTMYHNVTQQVGIASIVMKYGGWQVTCWRYLNITLALFIYTLIYPSQFSSTIHTHAFEVLIPLLCLSFALTYFIARKSQTRDGVFYAWGTAMITGVGTLAYTAGYPFIAATLLRVIHDITAFVFYIMHDINRNSIVMHNFIYRLLLPHTALFATGIPALAIMLTYLAQGGGTSMTIQIFFFVAVTHYYIEGFMWKNGSPHRSQLTFQYASHKIV